MELGGHSEHGEYLHPDIIINDGRSGLVDHRIGGCQLVPMSHTNARPTFIVLSLRMFGKHSSDHDRSEQCCLIDRFVFNIYYHALLFVLQQACEGRNVCVVGVHGWWVGGLVGEWWRW